MIKEKINMEKKIKVQFVLVTSIAKFASAASQSICSIDIKSGRQVIDGKSLMGIYSLDLSKPLTVVISAPHDDSSYEKSASDFIEAIKDIIVEE